MNKQELAFVIKKLIIDLQSSDSMYIYKTPELLRKILNIIENECD